jgi:hypothetical protein
MWVQSIKEDTYMKKSTTIRAAICDTTGEIYMSRGKSKKAFHACVSERREKGEVWRFALTPFEKKYIRKMWETPSSN